MKMTTSHQIKIASVALLVALSAGCESTRQAALPPPIFENQEIAFPKEMNYARELRVTDKNDPKQIVNFALSLSQRGRHLQAAEFLNDAAERFVSRDNEFGVTCRAAAANEFLQANDMSSFRETVARLRREMNRFQLASADEPIATVLSLGDLAAGADRPSSLTPRPLRELYPSGPAAAGPAAAGRSAGNE